ncbi:hypothetical protein NNJEOMEG_00232 [Fundidesulfovibrio magnetotacticus]|uniref:Membrane protein involved in the export of O-antigen and teichoic acid n=1 Tax=Fundidesulfovibrio magnetotacticus TaxID=2730080 RepID=A0A6V8LS22_9BACT|nr:oligosaccharide flippase family protein [Fundidesulfovibrio magnetotacticus]GFK92407.1 hypothetical protein NNJEOMEG_00232 [Fundidesulfovibrio magnetotacticus]
MSAARRFAQALAGQWSATVYCAVLATLLSFVLGRVLGPDAFGVYSYIITLASLFAILQDGGFSTLIFRETAHPSEHLTSSPPLLRQALTHCALTTLAGLGLVLIAPLEHKAALALAVLYYALFSAGSYLSAALKGSGAFVAEARWRMTVRTATAAAVGLALLVPGAGVAALFGGYLAGQLLALALPMAAPVRLFPAPRIDPSLYRSCGAFLLISAATTIYFKSDIILLTQLTADPAEVGQYAAAYRLVEAAVLFSSPLAHIFFRTLRTSLGDAAAFRSSFRRQLAAMCLLAVSGTALALWLGPGIIRLAFGERFGPAGELCAWVLPSLLFILPNGLLTQALIAMGREGFYARVTVVTALLNIALNAALIPFFGAKGSAAATVATEAALALGLTAGYLKRS